MSMLITNGLGVQGDGTSSGLLITSGLGSAGSSGLVSGDCASLKLLAASNTGTYIDLIFNYPIRLDGPAAVISNWSITPTTDKEVAITSLVVANNRILVYTSEQDSDILYTLNIPLAGVVSTSWAYFGGSYNPTFLGLGFAPTILMARTVDGRTLEVIFSEAVNPDDALDASKYSINNGLTVSSVTKISSHIFRLVTSKQTVGQSYTVTATGVRDLSGNLI